MESPKLVIISAMKLILPISIVLSAIVFEAPGALADYTLELKNGRRITVQSYREDRGMIKFNGLGGEIGLSKDQIQSIRQTAATDSGGLNVGLVETSAPQTTVRAPASTGPATPRERPPTAEEEKAKEEKEYLDKVKDLTNQLKSARDQYSQAVRGYSGAKNQLITDPEQIGNLQDDTRARQLDAQRNPVDPGKIKVMIPSPFTSLPPDYVEGSANRPAEIQAQRDFSTPTALDRRSLPLNEPRVSAPPLAYTDRQQGFSELRNQAIKLEQERDKLINEMRQKNLDTGALFLE